MCYFKVTAFIGAAALGLLSLCWRLSGDRAWLAVASAAVTDSTALFCRAISYCARAVYACVLFVRPAPPMLHTRLSVAGNTAPTAQSVLLLWCPASPYRPPYTHVGVQPLTTCTY
jgi:hypothetical protein